MDGSARCLRRVAWILGILLFCRVVCPADTARAQTPGAGQGQSADRKEGQKAGAKAQSQAEGRGAKPAQGKNQGQGQPAPAAAPAPGQAQARGEPSAAYRESLRRTIELRRQRRASRRGGLGAEPRPLGAIVPWPMPAALIIRQTPEVHGDVDSMLGGLRR
jgi:hypothetical protein